MVAPFIGIFLVVTFHFLPVWLGYVVNDSPELIATAAFRGELVRSFLHGQWPLWNPLLGPGGSAGQIYAVISWDYHLLLGALLPNWHWQVALDALVMGVAFLFAVRWLDIRPKFAWFCLPCAFLFFYTMDFVHVITIPLYYTSLYVAFPLALALTYSIETQSSGTRKRFAWLAFLYAVSFVGSKIEVWALQFPAALMLWIIGIRVSTAGCRLIRREDWRYVGILVVGWTANLWQLRWLTGLIDESGRTGFQGLSTVPRAAADFASSLTHSSLLWFLVPYAGITWCLFYGIEKKKPAYFLGLVGILLLGTWFLPFAWLQEDVIPRGCVALIPFGFVYRRLLKGDKRTLGIELPLLLLCVAHFLLENAHTWNWGPTSLESYSLPLLLTLFTGIAFSLLSPRRELRAAALTVLVGVYFFRAHLSIFSIQVANVVWHNQRDTFIPSTIFAILFLLGLETWFAKFSTAALRPRLLMLVGLGLVGIMNLVGFQRVNFFSRVSAWTPNRGTNCTQRLGAVLSQRGLTGADVRFAGSPWSVMPGSLLPWGVHHLNVYDSLVTKETKTYLSSASRMGPVRDRCQLVYLWLPNNIARVLGCSEPERQWHYNAMISPMFDWHDEEELARVGVNLTLSNRALRGDQFSLVQDLPSCVGTPEYPKEAKLYAARIDEKSKALVLFQGGVSDCSHWDERKAAALPTGTNLFDGVPLKDRFRLSVRAPEAGCLFLRVTSSRFWRYFRNGETVTPQALGVFTGIPIAAGETVITARYLSDLPLLLGLGVFILAVLLARALWPSPL